MTAERNGPFYRLTLTDVEMVAIRANFPHDMQQKILEAEKAWEDEKPRIRYIRDA